MIPGPEQGAAAGHGRLRASHADREQVIGTLKTAFADGRLDKDALDARVGQALAARTFAELATATAGIPAAPARPRRCGQSVPAPGPRRARPEPLPPRPERLPACSSVPVYRRERLRQPSEHHQ